MKAVLCQHQKRERLRLMESKNTWILKSPHTCHSSGSCTTKCELVECSFILCAWRRLHCILIALRQERMSVERTRLCTWVLQPNVAQRESLQEKVNLIERSKTELMAHLVCVQIQDNVLARSVSQPPTCANEDLLHARLLRNAAVTPADIPTLTALLSVGCV